MHQVVIPDTNDKFYIPSSLAECTSQQYIDFCALIFRFQSQELDYEQFRIQAIYKLCNLKQSTKVLSEEEDLEKWTNIYKLSLYVDEFFELNEDKQRIIKMDFTNNPVPSIYLWKDYYGPSDQFMNINFGEYTDALRLFHDFNATGDIDLLYVIAAILYRPKKSFHFIKKHLNNYDGDIRVPYNSKIIDKRADKFKFLSVGFVYGVYMFFASFQKFLTSATIPWGGKEIDLSILFESQNDESDENKDQDIPGIGMDSIMFTIAESGAFGSTEEVRKINLWEIMIRMYDLRKRDLDQKNKKPDDQSAES